MNKKLTGLLLFLLIVFHSSINSYGYFATADSSTNLIKNGGVNTEIAENVKVKNLGPSDCYVRLRVEFLDSDIAQLYIIEWNDKAYIYNEKDGFWYYIKSLEVGEETSNLFASVIVSEDITGEELDASDILIYSEAHHSDGYEDYLDAWEHYTEAR